MTNQRRRTLRGVSLAVAAGLLAMVGPSSVSAIEPQHGLRVEHTTAPQAGLTVSLQKPKGIYRILWPGHRILHGTVESIHGDLVKVNTGEMAPRFLSAKEAIEKGLPPLQRGQTLQLAVNDHNIVVDYHIAGREVWHRIIRGQLAQPLPVGQEWAVIRTERGNEEALAVRPLARSKVSAIPVGAPALFLVDESGKIIDAAFGSESALQHQTHKWKMSPPKAPYQRLEGVVVRSPRWALIKTPDGKERAYEVRPYLQQKLRNVEGQSAVVMLDDENKIADIAGVGM
ncbi:MAG TPA: hypothetical protein VFS39_17400 [Nitrospira sp.]|nr:hypothetical protein [Nitrospira sp.]